MKKSLIKIVTLGLFFIFASAYTGNPDDNKVGYMAPNFTLSNAQDTMTLQREKGKYLLLTFWSSDDVPSRLSNIRYDRATRKMGIRYVAVNYDRSRKIYQEIVKVDSLRESTQFYDQEGKGSNLYASYRLDQGLKSYLLDPTGKIIAENPSNQQLAKIVSQ